MVVKAKVTINKKLLIGNTTDVVISRDIRKTLKKVGERYIKTLRKERLSKKYYNPQGPGLHTRTGKLKKRSSFRIFIKRTKTELNLTVQVGLGLKYSQVQEDKETKITPKNAEYLAIPLFDRLVRTSRGVQRYASPRQVPGKKFFIKTKNNKLLIVKKVNKKLRYLYVLKKSVVVKGRMQAQRVAMGKVGSFRPRTSPLIKGLRKRIIKELEK